uniref:Type IV pilus assembly PilZ n=1 Tax=Rhodopseudomonas palustris (strain BisA53) TaxID=316055 RepID=Q07J66_RHOP5
MIERRRAVRTISYLPSYVRVLASDSYIDCTVLDISETGAKVSVASPVTKDALIELHIPAKGQVLSATVVWSDGAELGASFQSVYSVEETAAALLRFATQLQAP